MYLGFYILLIVD